MTEETPSQPKRRISLPLLIVLGLIIVVGTILWGYSVADSPEVLIPEAAEPSESPVPSPPMDMSDQIRPIPD